MDTWSSLHGTADATPPKIYVKCWGGPSKFWGFGLPQPPVVASLTFGVGRYIACVPGRPEGRSNAYGIHTGRNPKYEPKRVPVNNSSHE